MDIVEMDALQAAQQRAIAAGVNPLHKNTEAKLQEARQRAAERFAAQTAPPDAASRKEINRLFGVLARWVTAILLVGGISALLIAIPLAEVTAVYAGLLAVTPEAWFLAALTAVALFIGYLVVAFLVAAYYLQLAEERAPQTLRTRLAAWIQWVGRKEWQGIRADETLQLSKTEETYNRLNKGLWWAKGAILLASLRGRLDTVVTAHGGDPLGTSLSNSASTITGAEVINIVLTLFVLFSLLVLLDTAIKFVYMAFVNSAGRLDLGNSASAGGVIVSLEALEAQALTETYLSMALVMEAKALQASNPQPVHPTHDLPNS